MIIQTENTALSLFMIPPAKISGPSRRKYENNVKQKVHVTEKTDIPDSALFYRREAG